MAMTAKRKLNYRSTKYKYIVYKTTCLVNNKIYIGVHKTENPDVFDGYIGCGVRSNKFTHCTTIFHKAVKKYGYENFKRETLFVFNHKKPAYKKEAELVTQDFIELDTNYNSALGGGGGIKNARAVYQFDLTGKLLEKYPTIYDAAKSLNRPYKSIATAIATKGQCVDTLWSRQPKIAINEYNTVPAQTYFVYNTDGSLCAESLKLSELLDMLESNTVNISRTIKLQNKIKGFFVTTERVTNFKVEITPTTGMVNQYSPEGVLLQSFTSIAEARAITGLKLCSVSQAIKLFRKCNGFYWTRSNTPPKRINTKYVKR